jgi:hypothetical protein
MKNVKKQDSLLKSIEEEEELVVLLPKSGTVDVGAAASPETFRLKES